MRAGVWAGWRLAEACAPEAWIARCCLTPPSAPTLAISIRTVHVAEELLSSTSIGILAVFTAELAVKLCVFGFKYFTHSKCVG